MRLQILSDLHLDIWGDSVPIYDTSISKPDAVVLAGDIHKGDKAVAWAERQFAGIPVLYVHGNHEAYGKNLEDMQADIARACKASSNVHFLDSGEFKLGDIRFVGATLWTDFCLFGEEQRYLAMQEAAEVMADYERICLASDGYRKLQPADTALMHARQKSWLCKQLDSPFHGKTVVITHMAPSMQSVALRYAEDLSSAAFASNLEQLAARADLWIHGHMHDSFDYRLGTCRVICNPCGYPLRNGRMENASFDPNLVVTL
ncbi:metallophosphoesterase [Undibacterium sp. TS12]|uniref:metallophosphoesterase n=1 Tax=Undibacterium sp. TS12 TaxID=2908202 RepID=UPI001F4D0CB0|nr:metallophosphoesterase [Undibacterium sp. TS12]MCH8622784.1 metallophosphoesterase [Undibacterium sp. TS12]